MSFSDFFLACDEGKYGEECKHSCSCRNNATCDHVTGICNCSSVKGKTGTLCDEGETIVKKTQYSFEGINGLHNFINILDPIFNFS